jgi:hypothetical protein
MNYLSDYDKQILALYKNTSDIEIGKKMSIFSTLGEYKSIDGYKYYESYDNEYVYYIPGKIHGIGVFVDKNRKILFNSKYFTFFPGLLEEFLQNILPIVNDLDFDNNTYIDDNIIAITKWFDTYGHYTDEIFNLCNYYEKIKNIIPNNYKILVDYAPSSIINYSMDNYQLLNSYLFENNITNANNCIFKLKKILLIEHVVASENFHTFPITAKNKILTKIRDLNLNYKNIFITRGNALHMPRNLSNQTEIEKLLELYNYVVINPELMDIESFINSVRNADNVFITWGGALTNLIYLKHHANVYIMRSKSYSHESIDLFKFLFDKTNYNLNTNIIDADSNNNINTSHITDILDNQST